MGTEILKSYSTLQSELEQAKSSLKGVDESIKRLIGRDPSEFPPRPPLKRGVSNDERPRIVRTVVRSRVFQQEEEPPLKRRIGVSVFKRLSDRPVHYKDELPNKQMISKVIVTPREVPSRQEALAAQSKDVKFKERNRRMFGALLGTLQKFQQEETKLKQREDKRAQVEKKIEEHEIKEKEEIKKERQGLFLNRKKKQAEIKMIELKMLRMKEYAAWEERQRPKMHFIKTKTKPHIYYLPRRMNDGSKALLESCKAEMQKMMDTKKQEVCDELQRIEERMKRNFEEKILTKDVKRDHDDDDDDSEEDDDDHDTDRHRDRVTDHHQDSHEQDHNQETKTIEENKVEANEDELDKIIMPDDNTERQEDTNEDKNDEKNEIQQSQACDEKEAAEGVNGDIEIENKKEDDTQNDNNENNRNPEMSRVQLVSWNNSVDTSHMSWGENAWQVDGNNTNYANNDFTQNNENTNQMEVDNIQVDYSTNV